MALVAECEKCGFSVQTDGGLSDVKKMVDFIQKTKKHDDEANAMSEQRARQGHKSIGWKIQIVK